MSETMETPVAAPPAPPTPQEQTPAPATPNRLSARQAAEILFRERAPTKQEDEQPAKPEPAPAPVEDAQDEPADQTQETEADNRAPDAAPAAEDDPEYEVGPQKQRVKLSELRDGYLRHGDYTRKTTELAEARRAFDNEQSAVRQERAEYAQLLSEFKRRLDAADNEPGVDMDKLRQVDPVAWMEKREEARMRAEKRAAIAAEEQRLASLAQIEQQQGLLRMREHAGQVLLAAVPEWRDQATRQKELGDIVQMAKEVYGYTQAEIDMVIDPRYILLARDAFRLRKQNGQAVAAKRTPPTPVRPMPRARPTPPLEPVAQQRKLAQERFNKRPTLNNAVEALLAERAKE